MRSSLHSFLLVLAFLAAGPVSARADLITLSISEQGTGTLGGQAFTNQLVTFSGSFTTETLAACQIGLIYQCGSSPGGDFFFDTGLGLSGNPSPLTVNISVGGLGTFIGENLDYVGFLYTGNLEGIVVWGEGDSGGHFDIPTPPQYLGAGCIDYLGPFYCPIRAYTSGGDLMLTSVADSYFTSVEITDTSAVPEPETLALLTTGLLGIAGILRRRLLR